MIEKHIRYMEVALLFMPLSCFFDIIHKLLYVSYQ
jgi:hypothetical protein